MSKENLALTGPFVANFVETKTPLDIFLVKGEVKILKINGHEGIVDMCTTRFTTGNGELTLEDIAANLNDNDFGSRGIISAEVEVLQLCDITMVSVETGEDISKVDGAKWVSAWKGEVVLSDVWGLDRASH